MVSFHRKLILSSALVAALVPTSLVFSEDNTSNAPSGTTNLSAPSKELESAPITGSYAGKVVRNIDIVINDVFDSGETGFYHMVNELKINTKKEILERELLFKKGDRLDPFLVDETLRILRSLAFIRRVSITPTVSGPYVDILVKVSDTWTLIPQAAYSSGDGRDRRAIGLAESNTLGYGNRIEGLYRIDDNTESIEFVWDDRRFIGTDYDMVVGLFDRSDGNRYLFNFEEPFRSLVDKQAWTTRAEVYDGLDRLYKDSDENFIYRTDSTRLDASFTTAHGDPTSKLNRYSLGYRYLENTFSEASEDEIDDLELDEDKLDQDPSRLADNRRFSGPMLALSHIEPDYLTMNYIDRFDRVQDLNLGNQFGALAHLAPELMGSNQNALLYALSAARGFRFSPTSFLRSELVGTGRFDDGSGVSNTLLHGELIFFNVLGTLNWKGLNLGRHTLAGSWYLDYGDDFDEDRQLSLGADAGLRGYDARTFNGDKRTLLNLEDRMHFVDDVFQLISIGGSVFADIGGATYESLPNLFEKNIYADVGLGLVIGFPRSSGSKVLRVDLALPLRDAEDGTNSFKLRFIFSSGQTFNAQTATEELNATRPSVAVGF